MVMFMQGRRLVRAEELADNFEVSVRTIYRDIAALSEAGVAISGEAGVGYSLVKGYHLPPVALTAKEAGALMVGAEMVGQFTDDSLREPMRTALDKLRALLPRERQDELERLARGMRVVGCGSVDAEKRDKLPSRMWPVQEAVVARRVLRLFYRGRDKAKAEWREVEPLGVVYYGQSWYLVAWCRLREGLRHFRLDRIGKLETTEQRFVAREGFDLARHLAEPMGKDRVEASVWVAGAAGERAMREGGGALREVDTADGGTVFVLSTYSLDWVARWVLSFAGDMRVIEPPELVEQVEAQAMAILEQHRARLLT